MNDQQIIQALAKIREERLPLCECGEMGKVKCPHFEKIYIQDYGAYEYDCSYPNGREMPACDECDIPTPCPKCLPMRELELCWHGDFKTVVTAITAWGDNYGMVCGKCNAEYNLKNPDLTTHQHGSKLWITHALQVLGVWGEFYMHICKKHAHAMGDEFFDIFTDGEHLVPAIGAWLQSRALAATINEMGG